MSWSIFLGLELVVVDLSFAKDEDFLKAMCVRCCVDQRMALFLA